MPSTFLPPMAGKPQPVLVEQTSTLRIMRWPSGGWTFSVGEVYPVGEAVPDEDCDWLSEAETTDYTILGDGSGFNIKQSQQKTYERGDAKFWRVPQVSRVFCFRLVKSRPKVIVRTAFRLRERNAKGKPTSRFRWGSEYSLHRMGWGWSRISKMSTAQHLEPFVAGIDKRIETTPGTKDFSATSLLGLLAGTTTSTTGIAYAPAGLNVNHLSRQDLLAVNTKLLCLFGPYDWDWHDDIYADLERHYERTVEYRRKRPTGTTPHVLMWSLPYDDPRWRYRSDHVFRNFLEQQFGKKHLANDALRILLEDFEARVCTPPTYSLRETAVRGRRVLARYEDLGSFFGAVLAYLAKFGEFVPTDELYQAAFYIDMMSSMSPPNDDATSLLMWNTQVLGRYNKTSYGRKKVKELNATTMGRLFA